MAPPVETVIDGALLKTAFAEFEAALKNDHLPTRLHWRLQVHAAAFAIFPTQAYTMEHADERRAVLRPSATLTDLLNEVRAASAGGGQA